MPVMNIKPWHVMSKIQWCGTMDSLCWQIHPPEDALCPPWRVPRSSSSVQERAQGAQALLGFVGAANGTQTAGPAGAERSLWGWNQTWGLFHTPGAFSIPLGLQCHGLGCPRPLLLQLFQLLFLLQAPAASRALSSFPQETGIYW